MSTTPQLTKSLNKPVDLMFVHDTTSVFIRPDSKSARQRHHLAQLNAALIGGHAHSVDHVRHEAEAIQKRIVYQPGADAAFLAQYRAAVGIGIS